MNTDEYVKLAEVEDGMWYFRSLHAHVDRELSGWVPAGGAVLDAGCGTGGLILRLQARHPGWTLAGIDFMALACTLARQRCGPAVEVREASITALPFADASFDAVVSADVVCQVMDPEVAAAEFLRVLRPGGRVVVNVPAYRWMWSYHDDSCQTKHRYTRPEVAALLRGAGFADVTTTHWNALPFPAVWAKRKLFRRPEDTSDVRAYPSAVEGVCSALMAAEHAWLDVGGRWAWGTSVLGVGVKPA